MGSGELLVLRLIQVAFGHSAWHFWGIPWLPFHLWLPAFEYGKVTRGWPCVDIGPLCTIFRLLELLKEASDLTTRHSFYVAVLADHLCDIQAVFDFPRTVTALVNLRGHCWPG